MARDSKAIQYIRARLNRNDYAKLQDMALHARDQLMQHYRLYKMPVKAHNFLLTFRAKLSTKASKELLDYMVAIDYVKVIPSPEFGVMYMVDTRVWDVEGQESIVHKLIRLDNSRKASRRQSNAMSYARFKDKKKDEIKAINQVLNAIMDEPDNDFEATIKEVADLQDNRDKPKRSGDL